MTRVQVPGGRRTGCVAFAALLLTSAYGISAQALLPAPETAPAEIPVADATAEASLAPDADDSTAPSKVAGSDESGEADHPAATRAPEPAGAGGAELVGLDQPPDPDVGDGAAEPVEQAALAAEPAMASGAGTLSAGEVPTHDRSPAQPGADDLSPTDLGFEASVAADVPELAAGTGVPEIRGASGSEIAAAAALQEDVVGERVGADAGADLHSGIRADAGGTGLEAEGKVDPRVEIDIDSEVRPATEAAVSAGADARIATADTDTGPYTDVSDISTESPDGIAEPGSTAGDVSDDAPSAFWLFGTSREPRARPDAEAGGEDTLAARPPDPPEQTGPPAPDPDANEFGVSPMSILEAQVPPGSRSRLSWTTGQSFSGTVMETPVIVVHGIKPGPRLCLIAGIHGDELNSVEVVRRLAYKIEPEQLAGTVIAVPIVNLLGFSRGSRYLPDRRDLNRFFPGSAYGSSASRIAHSFFGAVVSHCDALVDFHTGSFDRSNLPQVRGDLTIPSVVEFTRGFGATAVLHSPGAVGMLRHAATKAGIPSVTFEIGAPLRLQPEEIEHGEQAIETLMHKMGMVQVRRRWTEPQAVFYESTWIRVDQGGMLFSDVDLGDRVRAGQRLGRVIDPVSNRSAEVLAGDDGRVIGMALNQLVLPGFAAYHIGVEAGEDRVVNEAERQSAPDDERFMEYDQLDADGAPGLDAGPETEAMPDRPPQEERGDG